MDGEVRLCPTADGRLLHPPVRDTSRLGLDVDWNPGGKVLVWQERKGLIRATPVPMIGEIAARERRPPFAPDR